MKNDYVVSKIYKSFVIVSILSSLTAVAGMLIDNVIAGQYLGQNAVGAMGIVSPVSLIFSAFGNICSGGGTARAAQAIGRGERDRVRQIFTVTMLFCVAAGAALTAAGLAFSDETASFLGARGELYDMSVDYLNGYFPGAVPTILMTAMMGFIRVDGSPRLPLVCITVMTAVNITLDLVMVLVFDKGMYGMALATTISYCAAAAVGCTHFIKKHNTLKLVPPKNMGKELGALIATGAPTALSRICDTIKTALLNNMLVLAAGAAAVTALSVRTQTNNILGAVIIGIGQAALPVIGMFFGEKDISALKGTLKTTLKLGLTITCIMAVVLFIFPSVFAMLFGVTDGETLAMAETAVRIFTLSIPVIFLNSVFMSFYQSTKRSGLATLICVLQSFAYTVLFAFILINPMGSGGVWLAFFIGEVLTLLTIIIYVTCKNKKFSLSLSAFMMIGENIGEEPKDRLELSIGNSMDEVMTISSGIYKFGKNRNIDKKTLNMISLCIEEIAGNVVQHAFKPGEKKWFDLMVLDAENTITLRIRDNGRFFDPVAYAHSEDERDDKKHNGIKIVSAVARNIEYRYNMGLNNLIIELEKKL